MDINIQAQQSFIDSIEHNLENAYFYKEEMTQAISLSIVPFEIQNIQDQVDQLKELLNWFKKEFFTWCNKPKCPICDTETNMERYGDETPNADDLQHNANRIESYRCTIHNIIQRFPRYNNPLKLLETRTGRCGEWANAFTCLCIALGHDARKAIDWTDHVWTEVYIDSYQRWVHLDSCENIMDQPLTYEKGWGKKLNYVIAISSYDVTDVTNRYVIDPCVNLTRRDKVDEKWLHETLKKKRESLWEMQGKEKAQYLKYRFDLEKKQLISNTDPLKTDQEFLGRQSGSLEWKQQRQEMGSNDNAQINKAQLSFIQSIENHLENAFFYKEELTQAISLSIVPYQIQNIQDQVDQLKELLNWFKKEFFTWCNKPKCPICDTETNMERYGDETPNADDLQHNANRIESYRCTIHNIIQRFPRYNNPLKLLETRTGRCGEWANAFTCLCIALGHDARKAIDWTDHVWTEVYIDSYQRWVHLDSCENIMDQPLTYEKGWGKKLNYVIAISSYDVTDVTNRYVIDPCVNLTRRDKVDEKWLHETLKKKRESLWEMQGKEKAQYLKCRFDQEKKQLISNTDPLKTDQEFLVRQSGSLEWKQQRQEMGSNDNKK